MSCARLCRLQSNRHQSFRGKVAAAFLMWGPAGMPCARLQPAAGCPPAPHSNVFIPLIALADAVPAALDQKHQNDHKQRAGDNPNQSCIVHMTLLSVNYLKYFPNESTITI